MSFFGSHSSKIDGDAPGVIALGLLLAAVVQVLFYSAAAAIRINPTQVRSATVIIHPVFDIKKVEISAEDLEEPLEPHSKVGILNKLPEILLPSENPGDDRLPDEIRVAPLPPTLSNPFDESQVRAQEQADLAKAASGLADIARQSIEQQQRAEIDQLLEQGTRPDQNSRVLLDLSDISSREISNIISTKLSGKGSFDVPNGYTSIDEALASKEHLRTGVAPILMPTDLLFEYDQYRLQPQAVESLTKLGDLIRRNPQAAFIIEGHTDSEGPADYNQMLSEKRAATVARWLIENMKIDPRQITTRGYGKTRLIVPGDRPREEQAINRRVEIIIRNR